jgi:hypothetical protein
VGKLDIEKQDLPNDLGEKEWAAADQEIGIGIIKNRRWTICFVWTFAP